MKITVDIPESVVKKICRLTGESKKGPAVRKLVRDHLKVLRREVISR